MNGEKQQGTSAADEGGFRAAVIGGAIALCAVILFLRFGDLPELPPMPAQPAGALERAQAVADGVHRSDAAYRARVERDAKQLGVATTAAEMERAFVHREDEPGALLDPRGDKSVEAAGLRLSLQVEPVPGSHRRQMVLAIESLLDRPAAYRVVTRPSGGTRTCRHKRSLPHDAIAIAPGATERRSECTYEPGWGLEVRRVETLELPELGYIYVSQLRPRHIALSKRTSGAHRPVVGAPCDLILSARVTKALEEGELGWRDAVDFYARHDCRTFTIPPDYEAFDEDGELALPVTGAGP